MASMDSTGALDRTGTPDPVAMMAVLNDELANRPEGVDEVEFLKYKVIEARIAAWDNGAEVWKLYSAATGAKLADFAGLPGDYPTPTDVVRAHRYETLHNSITQEQAVLAAQATAQEATERYDALYAQALKAVLKMRATGYWSDPTVVGADNWPDMLVELLDWAKDRVVELNRLGGQRNQLEAFARANWPGLPEWENKTVLEVVGLLLNRLRQLEARR